MRKILCAICTMLLAASAAQADSIALILPPAGSNSATGLTYTTEDVMVGGATFDIDYTLNAFATDTSVAPFIRTIGNGAYFGVGSVPDGTNNSQLQSIDGGDGEMVSFTGLAIDPASFDPGTSGLTLADFTIAFESITPFNGSAQTDGIDFSHVGFGDADALNATSPANNVPIDISGLTGNAGATSLFVEPDGTASNNRFSIAGISVQVTSPVPEPSSLSILGLSAIGMLVSRRKRS